MFKLLTLNHPPLPPPFFPPLLPHLFPFFSFFLTCFCIPYSLFPTLSFSKLSFRCCQIVYDLLIALMCVIALTCTGICALVWQTPRWSDTKPHLSTSSTFKDNQPPCWLREMENRQRERKRGGMGTLKRTWEREKESKMLYGVFLFSCFCHDITAQSSKDTHNKEIKLSHFNLVILYDQWNRSQISNSWPRSISRTSFIPTSDLRTVIR